MKYRTDLILGEAFCIFIFFYFLDSGLSVLNGLQFYFDCVTVKTPHRKEYIKKKQKLLRVSGRFELSRVRVTEGKIIVILNA